MTKKHLNLTNALVNFDSSFKETLLEILPDKNFNLESCDTNIFGKDIEEFIKKYGSDNYSSIDDLLESNGSKSYFEEENSSNLNDLLDSLIPK